MLFKKTICNKFFVVYVIFLSGFAFSMDTISIPDMMYNIDVGKNLIVVNYDVNTINTKWTKAKSFIRMDKVYKFSDKVKNVDIGKAYQITPTDNNIKYQLYFTQLPIVSISTNHKITSEEQVFASFKLVESNQKRIISNIGISYRGVSSIQYPKKSLRIGFFDDTLLVKARDISLLGMHTDDDWNLQAMYIEPLRLRCKIGFDIWKMIHTIYYKDKEPNAASGIEMKYAEMFLNGSYQGVYCIGERVNRKLLKLKKYEKKSRGELYKAINWYATFDSTLYDYDNEMIEWYGFEFKYPETIDWSNLYELIDFIKNEKDKKFYSNYSSKFHIDNLIDYFILLNLIYASDNHGKNSYIARYDEGEPYFYVPWDLDATFGIMWRGKQENNYNGLLLNVLYKRLWNESSKDGFREKLKTRWLQLRDSIITLESIIGIIKNNYDYLNQNGVYGREALAWSDYKLDTDQLEYIQNWVKKRIPILDKKFVSEYSSIKVGMADKKRQYFRTLPNPVSDVIKFDFVGKNLFHVSIFDCKGAKVLETQLSIQKRQINVSKLPSGVYYLKVNSDKVNKFEKLIIQK